MLPLKHQRPTRRMTQKKKVAIMRNEKKILKHNSLASGIIIKFGLALAVLAVVVYLVSQISISTGVAALAIGWLVIRLVVKLVFTFIRIVLSILFTGILIALITFLIL